MRSISPQSARRHEVVGHTRDNTPIGRGREHRLQALRPNYRTYSMVSLPVGNRPSIRLCARGWWISVLFSEQANRFTCASRKVA
jgi:hypothetical protein